MRRISAGTACTEVHAARSSTSRGTSGTRSRGTSRTVPPPSRGRSVSNSQMSKAKEASEGTRSPAPNPNASPATASVAATLPCGTRTPLGRPVEPEV